MESEEAARGLSIKDIFAGVKPTKNITKLISVGFGLILISWLLAQLEWAETVETIREVPVSLLVLGFLCYALSFYLRARRFRLLLPSDKPVKHLFPIVLVHYTALNIIPARLGELSYVYLLKKINNISVGCSLSSLIMARVFDQIAISGFFLLSCLFVRLPSPWLKTLVLMVGGMLIIVFVLLMLILAYKEKCVWCLKHIFHKLNWDRYRIVQRVTHEIEEVVTALNGIRFKKRLVQILGLSVGIWLNIFSVNYLLLRALNVPLSYMEMMLASTFMILLTILPIHMLSGVGIRETTWVFIALALNVSRTVAITAAFGTRILSTIYLFIFGGYGLWRLKDFFRNAKSVS